MKKAVCALLCLSILMLSLPALGADITDVMRVVNCQEWVSLREAPDTSSTRLAKVYLGEFVTFCNGYWGDFIECVYNDQIGYIQKNYLQTTSHTNDEVFPGNQMVVNVSEWASMWVGPYTSSGRVTTVPVGSIVRGCVTSSDGSYVYCEYKSGSQTYKGYIGASYLKKANYTASTKNDKVTPAPGSPTNGLTMIVVNCEEWVSLREKASAYSARLARVPLGAQVEECVQVSDTFVYCKYNGLYGYIQLQYLSESESNEPDPEPLPGYDDEEESFDSLPENPPYEDFQNVGFEVLHQTYKGYYIVVRKIYDDYDYMMAVLYDLDFNPKWELRTRSLYESSDVNQLDAFIAGTTEDPQLIWYIHGMGFYSYDIEPVLKTRWFLSSGLDITDSIVHGVHYDGSFCAAFEDVVLRVSADGKLLWRTDCEDPDLFYPAQVTFELDESAINVYYDNLFDNIELQTWVRFSMDGERLSTSTRVAPY